MFVQRRPERNAIDCSLNFAGVFFEMGLTLAQTDLELLGLSNPASASREAGTICVYCHAWLVPFIFVVLGIEHRASCARQVFCMELHPHPYFLNPVLQKQKVQNYFFFSFELEVCPVQCWANPGPHG
jgi:hypothetical protein